MFSLRLTLGALAVSAAALSVAQSYTLNYNQYITGTTQSLTMPVATAKITQVNANQVRFRLTLSSLLPAGSFVRTMWFNSDSFTSGQVSGLDTFTSVGYNASGFNAAGGYEFTGEGNLPNSGGSRLTAGESAEFTITKTGILASSFLVRSSGSATSVATMLHLQGLSGGSVHYGAVPEPASMAALGLGALALVRRRRAKK